MNHATLSDFMPHGHCYYWEPYILWSHAISDGIIALAYCAIPLSLIYIFRKRRDFTFIWVMVLFSIFIFGCGITHLFDVITIWNPIYQADSVARMITAAASIGTALVLVRITPAILRIPSARQWIELNEQLQASNDQLAVTNEELQATVEELRLTNEKLLQTNTELDRTNQELDKSNQELGRFAYVASHDLQEPLRKVKTFSTFLIKEYTPFLQGNGLMYLGRMENAVGRMQQLIDDLLSYSRITRLESAFAPVVLNEVVDKVLDQLEIRIRDTGAQVSAGQLPIISGIASQMEQVFANLINNALKFTNPDIPPLVRIEATEAGQEQIQAQGLNPSDTFVSITVQDNGIGFEPEYAEKIFGIFQRLHGRQEYEGSGIGLSICRRIVENHGGRIYASSQKGQGAVFTLVLLVLHTKK